MSKKKQLIESLMAVGIDDDEIAIAESVIDDYVMGFNRHGDCDALSLFEAVWTTLQSLSECGIGEHRDWFQIARATLELVEAREAL